MSHTVIYIPGLGDSRVKGQGLAVKAWRHQNVRGELFQMNWINGEDFSPKLDRLLARVDELRSQNNIVSLVAASAGAGAALNAFAARQSDITGVVCICGQILGAAHVAPYVYGRNPAFQQSMQLLPDSLRQLDMDSRQRILSMRPLADESVPVQDTRLPGSRQFVMPVAGHAVGIGSGITIFSPVALRFLKRLARQ